MGVSGTIIGTAARGVGEAITGVAEVFTENRTARAAQEHQEHLAALAQHGAEFGHNRTWFDAAIDGLNRLPRLAMALGTMGLFVYAMQDPLGFAARMQGLALVPDPLWWLMGAVVSFYFGARELHHIRMRRLTSDTQSVARVAATVEALEDARRPAPPTDENPVVAEWRAGR
ncbi:holin family protein [Pontivivens ytuae]|uniref:Holin family protein n=1 Tax=Pontivivens ytuae TaxID=2789856 RepID=A0A7S9LR47_9RHOB|nr:holin family protein [Pontivivens ytuae]QPH53569.1 holin family protein [Pontivivens ytuae]